MAEESKTKRLCSEIQLFDLCSKDTCERKNGRFCTDSEMLAKFESISEEDVLQNQFTDEADDFEDTDEREYEDGCLDDFDDEDEDGDE
jgi:hypothetical protein